MASIAVLLRKVQLPLLRRYFASADIDLPVDWDGPTTTPVLHAIEQLDFELHARVLNDFSRVAALSDEAGQTALYAASQSRASLERLANRHARALWLFVNEPESFRRAEEVRYTDDHRRGKQWDGFKSDPGLEIRRDAEAVEAFKAAVRQRFGSEKVHIDLFDRQRKRHSKSDIDLIQATVYVEGRPDQQLEFVGDNLDLRDHRPVIEASLTYEPASGTVEVVAGDRRAREDFARVFAETLLSIEIKGERLPLRRFDLERLRHPFDFPTDPVDGIERVRVTSLRLMPLDTASQRLVLECMKDETGTIWQMSHSRLGANDPLTGGWRVTQVKFTIKFHPVAKDSRGKKLPVTITMPHSCDLKDRTEHERLIGEKYMTRWGLLRDV